RGKPKQHPAPQLSSIQLCSGHVRFTPESGHVQRTRRCLLWAKSGHRDDYSIASSATDSSDGGTVRPSVFAVLRLMANSKVTVCWIGKSAGFSPFKIRPAYRPARRYASVILAP